jgi:molybdenum cofactor cytidylyltransferase
MEKSGPSVTEIPRLLLAAGGSRRMGKPKALLPWGDRSLIEHQIRTLLQTDQPVVVVLGAQAARILPIASMYPVRVLVHENWEAGMGSTISFGISRLTGLFPEAAGVLIALLDQPLLRYPHFVKMDHVFQPGTNRIIVSRSASGWQGVPVLFDSFYFESLQTLTGEEGAKKIIRQHPEAVTLVECGELLDDMDTPKAYERLKTYLKKNLSP